jgi:hypothetical protein
LDNLAFTAMMANRILYSQNVTMAHENLKSLRISARSSY